MSHSAVATADAYASADPVRGSTRESRAPDDAGGEVDAVGRGAVTVGICDRMGCDDLIAWGVPAGNASTIRPATLTARTATTRAMSWPRVRLRRNVNMPSRARAECNLPRAARAGGTVGLSPPSQTLRPPPRTRDVLRRSH